MLKAFAVFDSQASAFGTPMFLPSSGVALRLFSEACANPKSPMFQHPQDFVLYELGTYDPNSGRFTSLDVVSRLSDAASVVAALRASRLVSEPVLPGVEVAK